jgi:hypothetical protein
LAVVTGDGVSGVLASHLGRTLRAIYRTIAAAASP